VRRRALAVEHADVGQVPVLLVEVQAVANDEAILNGEADEVDADVDFRSEFGPRSLRMSCRYCRVRPVSTMSSIMMT
jgi:hypothetical protein